MGKRIGVGVAVLLAVGGGVVALNWTGLSARLTESKFRSAATDEARVELAAKLLDSGDAGVARLVEALRTGTPEQCAAVAAAVSAKLADLSPDDPKFAAVCRPFLAACDTFSPDGSAAALDLVPAFLRLTDADAIERCRVLVKGGLAANSTEGKVRAVRLAMTPQMGLRAEVVPQLNDPAAEVRRVAVTAVGPPAVGGPVVETDELFRLLNDPDDEVRLLCEAALSTRGVEPEQIDAGRKLTHPEASERLTLLVDLERGRGGAFRDPGPWLERLSRDPDPAVRAGAARVAFESKLTFAAWLDRLTQDSDPTVRRIAEFHRDRADRLKQAGHRE